MSFSDVIKVVTALYVDDILILSDSIDIIRDLKEDEFRRNFQMKYLGVIGRRGRVYVGVRLSASGDLDRESVSGARDLSPEEQFNSVLHG